MTPEHRSDSIPNSGHAPVFLERVLEAFRCVPSVTSAWDGTFGRGGHAAAVLREFPIASLWAMDLDEDAIVYGREAYSDLAKRLRIVQSPFADFQLFKQNPTMAWPASFDVMLLDLGVSSPQLDQAARGFSFYHDGPLDMRMDRSQSLTAADVVNSWDEQDLARLFIEYGEVHRPFRVVRAIVNDRKAKPYRTTRDLASLIERVDGWRKKGSHPATKYFMALRLEVNSELRQLESTLPVLIDALSPGGVLAVISFHSLEDRIVKNAFKSSLEKGKLLNKKAIKPSDEEARANPRARSAKLRAFQKFLAAENAKGD